MAGITPTGFEAKSAAEILADVEAAQKAALGADLDVSPEQPLGQINGIFAGVARELWELAGAVFGARDPRSASGDGLTGLSLVTGTARRGAQKATAPLAVTLAAGVTLPAGSLAGSASDTTRQFATQAAVTNHGTGTATFGVTGVQVTAGVIPASTPVSTIVTPVTGWTAVSLTAPVLLGAPAEGDPTLRRRREREVQGAGSSPVEAIRTALSRVPLASDVQVFENTSSLPDVEGRPGHSVEAIVSGSATGAALALVLFHAKAGGIETYGLSSHVVGDALGRNHTVRLTVAADLEACLLVVVDVDPQNDPGDAAIKAAAVASLAGLRAGETARRSVVNCAVLDLAGLRDVLLVAIGSSSTTVAPTNFLVGARYRAVFATARVEVNRV